MDMTLKIMLGKKFTYPEFIVFLEEKNYKEAYKFVVEDFGPTCEKSEDFMILRRCFGPKGDIDLGIDHMISEETLQIILGFALKFDNKPLKCESDGSFAIANATNFQTAFKNATELFGTVNIYCGCTMWG